MNTNQHYKNVSEIRKKINENRIKMSALKIKYGVGEKQGIEDPAIAKQYLDLLGSNRRLYGILNEYNELNNKKK